MGAANFLECELGWREPTKKARDCSMNWFSCPPYAPFSEPPDWPSASISAPADAEKTE